jgi:FAD/FMN-containing dehydrogenase
MNKIAHYLQEHISGEVLSSNSVRRHFSTDASIFTITPSVVVYPRSEEDVRKLCRFTWQLAERGRIFPITARGSGTDQTGAAIGSGIVVVFPAHLNRLLSLDSKAGTVSVEPGINYGKLQQTLFTHDRFLPPYPASIEYSTVGGAVANNAGGDKSLRYGSTVDYVKSLRVVLANGEIMETGRLNKRDLSKKLGLATFEGEIYRTIDVLIEENGALIDKLSLQTTKNSSGYALNKVKRKDGSFDLTPLIVGSQGTLGLITEINLTTETRRPTSTLIAAFFEDLESMEDVIAEIRKFPELPSAIELVDDNLLRLVQAKNPNLIKDIIQDPFPKFVVLIEFDNPSEHVQKRLAKRAIKSLAKSNVSFRVETEEQKKEELWKIRHSTVAILPHDDNNARPLPIIEDGIVPPNKLGELITGIYSIFSSNNLPIALYGHAGDANLHIQPSLDLKSVGDRQRAFRLMDEYYKLVVDLGGTISAENGDGRLRGPFLKSVYGEESMTLFNKVKATFDPHGILNPGVKVNVEIGDIKPLLRDEYSLTHFYSHTNYL